MNDPKSYDPVTAKDDDEDDDVAVAAEDAESDLMLESDRTEKTMEGRAWTVVGASYESVTSALPIHQDPNRDDLSVVAHEVGCVLRVRARGLDGDPMLGLVWLPGVTLADLQTDPAEARRILAARHPNYEQADQVLRRVLLMLDVGDTAEARRQIATWLGVV